MKYFLSIIILLLFASCRTRYITLHDVEQRIDSITFVDTVLQVRLDVVHDSVSVDTTSSFLSNKYAYSWARFDGKLHHSLGVYDGLAPIEVKMPKEYVTITRYKDMPVPVEVPLSRIDQLKLKCFDFFAMMFLSLLVIVIILIRGR